MAPSEPPLAIRPSWCGCQARQLASFLCPLNVCTTCDKFLMSNNLRKWSLLAVINQFPFLFHLRSMTVDLWACKVVKDCPVFGSHNLMGCWLSLLPDAMIPNCGCQSQHLTSDPWPVKNYYYFIHTNNRRHLIHNTPLENDGSCAKYLKLTVIPYHT